MQARRNGKGSWKKALCVVGPGRQPCFMLSTKSYCTLCACVCVCVCVYKIFIESLYCTPLSTKPTIIILYRSPICVVIMWWGRGVFYDLMIKIQCFRGSRF